MGDAECLQSELFRAAGFRHGFFTRRGGVSSGPFASLNFTAVTGDEPANVEENIRRAALELGVPPSSLFMQSQVHGAVVNQVSLGDSPDEFLAREGDALLCFHAGIAVGVRTADCVPVLLADRTSGGVIAVHAGWRGAKAGIVQAAAERLRASCKEPDLITAIGPHISVDAFEVSHDVAQQLAACAPDAQVVRSDFEKPHVDLLQLIHHQLESAGVHSAQIEHVRGCTVQDEERFFSFRRDGKFSGRQLSAVVVGSERHRQERAG